MSLTIDTLHARSEAAWPVCTAAFILSTAAVSMLTGLVEVPSRAGIVYAGLAALPAIVVAFAVRPIVRSLTSRLERDATTVGPYTLGPKIGEGGMGEVYLARHTMMNRDVAIKILPHGHADEDARCRFEREVRLTSRLESPNTVAVYDSGRTRDGRSYYVMEHVAGYDLEDLVRKAGPLSPGRTIHILRQVCGALGEAHAAGLVHRDVKPANIALCERAGVQDVAKVLDFGLALELGSEPSAISWSGTPAYMAPETILSPSVVDPRSDLYALGAVAYWLLTGTPVFDGDSIVEICSHHVHTTPESPSSRLGDRLPADLEAVVLRCLAKHPADRYASMDALREALDACDAADVWTAEDASMFWRELTPCCPNLEDCAAPESPHDLTDELA